jgi:hypothetical protein
MSDQQTKQAILASLKAFAAKPLAPAAIALFESLGYRSTKRLVLTPNSPANFLTTFEHGRTLNHDQALLSEWESVDFLFQLTDDEVRSAAGGNQQFLFDSRGTWDGAAMESYLFFAITLAKPYYTRTELSSITRAVNRLFSMPAMLLFRHGDTLTLAVINRRLHKRDEGRDVLTKVTLIKDIRIANPHRAHVEILHDLSFDALHQQHDFSNFVALHRAWQETLDIQALNKRFFVEIRNWFYWARLHARFPEGARKHPKDDFSEALIRLLTRMIFCWFLREKRLIADELFSERTLETLMRDWRADDCEKDKQGRYYKAILQNLFFATLNTPVEERKFRSVRSYQGKNKHYGDQRYFRHLGLFHEKAPVEELYKTIPFLNGGLFEMLDEIPDRGDDSITEEKRVDGFSDVANKQPLVPDCLFFGDERRVPELSTLLGESTVPKARGLLRIFRDYKFTIEENTPLEQDIALDPELLGRAFENLLAAVNPETGTVARKSTGSFYTPREEVNYMVEEALIRCLFSTLSAHKEPLPNLEERLRELISAEKEFHRFSDAEADAIVAVIGQMRILDLACGSGAFPMGLLQRALSTFSTSSTPATCAGKPPNSPRSRKKCAKRPRPSSARNPSTTHANSNSSKTASTAWTSSPPPFKSANCAFSSRSSSSRTIRATSGRCRISKPNSYAPTRSLVCHGPKAGNFSNTRLSRTNAPCSACAPATSLLKTRTRKMPAVLKTLSFGRNLASSSKASAAAPLTSLPPLSPLGIHTSLTASPVTLIPNPCLASATASTSPSAIRLTSAPTSNPNGINASAPRSPPANNMKRFGKNGICSSRLSNAHTSCSSPAA